MKIGEIREVDAKGLRDGGEAAMDFSFVVFGGDEEHGARIGVMAKPRARAVIAVESAGVSVVLPSPPSPATIVTARSGIISFTIHRRSGGSDPAKAAAEMMGSDGFPRAHPPTPPRQREQTALARRSRLRFAAAAPLARLGFWLSLPQAGSDHSFPSSLASEGSAL